MTPLRVFVAAWLAALAPESGDDARARCLAQCDGIASATDAASCRLQCSEADKSRTAPNVVRWKRTDELGGAPPGAKNKGGTTTTTTIESPSGTTTTTESPAGKTTTSEPPRADGAHKSAAPTKGGAGSPAPADPYAALAHCQATCDTTKQDHERAVCKLGCLKTHPVKGRTPVFVPKPRTSPAPSKS